MSHASLAGGGYGGMAHVVLSFSAKRKIGHYHIYDLPEVCRI